MLLVCITDNILICTLNAVRGFIENNLIKLYRSLKMQMQSKEGRNFYFCFIYEMGR